MMDPVKVRFYLEAMMREGLGLDLTDPNLIDTPARMAKMYSQELFKNDCSEFDDFKSFPNDPMYDEIVMEDNILFTSTCSHHFLPFIGKAWVLYVPDKAVIGASKLARCVEHYAARPQLQERLCSQVADSLIRGLEPKGVMVVMRAVHQCMTCRGVRQSSVGMTTSVVKGIFRDDPTMKQEGFELIKLSLLDR